MSSPTTKPEKAETEVKLCSKCKERPRAHPESTNPWCRQCNTEKQVEYQGNRNEMTESRGFAAGQSYMRDIIARYFMQWPSARFSGAEASAMCQKAGLPQ